MAKGTIIFLFILAVVASLLFGINLGKKLEKSAVSPLSHPTSYPLPTINSPSLTPISSSTSSAEFNGKVTYTNPNCGYQISYPSTWIKYESDDKSVALAASSATTSAKIAIICAPQMAIPSLSPDKIADFKLGTTSAKIYHTLSPQDGSPLDEIIDKIPGKDMDIFIAGFGPSFTQLLSSFKFLP